MKCPKCGADVERDADETGIDIVVTNGYYLYCMECDWSIDLMTFEETEKMLNA